MKFLLYLKLMSLLLLSFESKGQASRSGMDHALFIIVSKYKDSRLIDLPASVSSSLEIESKLKKKFGFQTKVLHNPTLEKIQETLINYRNQYANNRLPNNGQFLIYFSGHGVKEGDSGYFLPSDANLDKLISTGFAYAPWRDFIDEIDCKHVLVAIDACFSVTFSPAWQSRGSTDGLKRFARPNEYSELERLLKLHETYYSRVYFTSDSKEDKTPGKSNFARKFLEGLNQPMRLIPFFTAEEIFANFIIKAEPAPKAGYFGKDNTSSRFLFFYQAKQVVNSDIEQKKWEKAIEKNTPEAYIRYLEEYPKGIFSEIAKQKIDKLKTQKSLGERWREYEKENTIKGYKEFLSLYGESVYAELANERLKILILDKSKKDCSEAFEKDEIEIYQNYLKRYKKGDCREIIKKKLEELEAEQEEEMAWELAKKDNTVEAFLIFKESFPESKYIAILEDMIKTIEKQEIIDEELARMQELAKNESYSTTTVNGLKWMSKNLNYPYKDSWCYGGLPENCEKYGRLYTWQAAKDACQALGWRLPTYQEWEKLGNSVILNLELGGYRLSQHSSMYKSLEDVGRYWSDTEIVSQKKGKGSLKELLYGSSGKRNNDNVWSFRLSHVNNTPKRHSSYKTLGLSCRCVKD